jgi:putative copper export protein
LLKTTVGRAIVGRLVASGIAGALTLAAMLTRDRARYWLSWAAVAATLAAMAIHTAAGHAAAASGQIRTVALIGQWAHFAAAGVWLGGLAALIIEVRGGPAAGTADAVRKFSRLALFSVAIIVATGVARSVVELTSWRDLIATPYGAAVLVKSVLFGAIVWLGAVHRRRSVPLAATTVRPLRRIGAAELGLAAITIVAAAMLGALPPPAAARAEPAGLSAEGSDFATTVRVRLIATSDQPGPNRFIVRAVDYDTREPVRARRVRIRFAPMDDPGVEPTTLDLAASDAGSYVGSGVHLAFAGRWQAIVSIERESGVVEVPLELEARTPEQWLSVRRTPGIPVQYTVSLGEIGDIRFSPDPERAGPSTVTISFFGFVHSPLPVGAVVVTQTDPNGHTVQVPVRHLDPTRVVANVIFKPGRNRLAAITYLEGGTRMRAVVDIDLPIRPLSN